MSNNPQLNRNGQLQHLLTTEGLPAPILLNILDTAESFVGVTERDVKKSRCYAANQFSIYSSNQYPHPHNIRNRGKAALGRRSQSQHSGLISDPRESAARYREQSFCHACRYVRGASRSKRRGAPDRTACAAQIHVINAGDGRHAHPTQGLLDVFTIRRYKPDFRSLRVAIVGDILHSRVARSQIHALTTLGVPEVRVIAPKTLLFPPRLNVWAYMFITI